MNVTINGCTSPDTSIFITVNPTPATPFLISNSPVCNGDSIVLIATSGSDGYIWTLPSSQTVTTTDSVLVIYPALPSNAGTYTVKAKVGNCISLASLPELVEVRRYLRILPMQVKTSSSAPAKAR